MPNFKEMKENHREELIEILKEYLEPRYWDTNDFDYIIDNAEIDKEWEDVQFHFNQVTIYLDYYTLEYKDAEPKEGI